MHRYHLTIVLLLVIAGTTHAAQPEDPVVTVEPLGAQDALLSGEELDELVAPVALYPDDLLAIVLPATTYPLQLVAAARYLETSPNDGDAEPDANWDESVVALLNYPEVVALLNEDLNWTWELGQSVLAQQADVLSAVQRFRETARAAGNLATDDKQVVAVEDDAVTIKSSDPEVIYVPYYEPEQVVVYQTRPVYRYYPRPYPVYYYPYSGYHRFYTGYYGYGFWGVSSIFSLYWPSYYVRHHHHHHHKHRYHGRRYHAKHFHRTRHYHNSSAYHRRVARRSHDHYRSRHRARHDYAGWRPDRRYAGDRPGRGHRHRGGRGDQSHRQSFAASGGNPHADRDGRRADRRRHTRRNGRHAQQHVAYTRPNRSSV